MTAAPSCCSLHCHWSTLLFSGYLIPKGWRIYVYTREINYDPFLYPDPLTFNPWRWLVSLTKQLFSFTFSYVKSFSWSTISDTCHHTPYIVTVTVLQVFHIKSKISIYWSSSSNCQLQDKSLESKNYFLIFGGGTRLCPGKELGITEISTFLHYFVTRYRWQIKLITWIYYLYTFSVKNSTFWISQKSWW